MARKKGDREPPAPTLIDEMLSQQSLQSSPWIRLRIQELNLKGKQVTGWTPPLVAFAKCQGGSAIIVRD